MNAEVPLAPGSQAVALGAAAAAAATGRQETHVETAALHLLIFGDSLVLCSLS